MIMNHQSLPICYHNLTKMYLSKMTYDLLEVFTVFLYCHNIHRQNQDISFCEILAYF